MKKKDPKSKKGIFKILQFLFFLSPFKLGLFLTTLFTISLVNHYRVEKDSLDIIGKIERMLYDIRFKLRGQIPYSGKVGVLGADDESIEQFGRWPFPRDIYEQVFKNLKNAGVKYVGFDVFFSEQTHRMLEESILDLKEVVDQGKIGPHFNKEQWDKKLKPILEAPAQDKSLAKGIEDFGNVVQGYFFVESENQIVGSKYDFISSFFRLSNSFIKTVTYPKNMSAKDYPYLTSKGVVTNTELISGKSRYMGFASNYSDPDGIMRKALLVKIIEPMDTQGVSLGDGVVVPSLSLKLASLYLSKEIVVGMDSLGVERVQLVGDDPSRPNISIPVYYDGSGSLLLNHYGKFYNIPYISLKDAYQNKLPNQIPDVLIFGATATGTNDKRPSPFDENFDGVGHHAAVVENIITQNFMQRPLSAPIIEVCLLILSGILFSFILKFMSALKSASFIFSFTILFYLIDRIYLFGHGYWYYVGVFYIQTFSIYFGITIFKYFTEEREKRKVKNAFSHYLNPSVISELMQNPDKLKLNGDKKYLTVFFSDIRGFTTISEALSPERLTQVLNEYFSPMTKIVLDSKGLLDKYIGDAMMAFWGAPLDLSDHADRAIAASLNILKELKVLQEKWKSEGIPYLDIGIGLNTGDVIVGNMGSDVRFDYTVLGDSVNLASRLEATNKNYGTRLIVSEFTRGAAKNKDQFLFRELDVIRVKGKNEGVRIFEVLCFVSECTDIQKKTIAAFQEALELYRKQKWSEAKNKFQEILNFNSEDGPSKIFLERIDYLVEHGVEANWDGIWTFKTK